MCIHNFGSNTVEFYIKAELVLGLYKFVTGFGYWVGIQTGGLKCGGGGGGGWWLKSSARNSF